MSKARSDLVTLGAVCMTCTHEAEENLSRYERFIAEAAASDVKLLVFPEISVQGYLVAMADYTSPATLDQLEWYRRVSETVPGPTTERIAALAREHRMVIQFGIAECNAARTKLHNSAVVVGPQGLIGVYRKVHNQNEWPVFQPGDAFPVFDTPVGRIGPFICADLHYPECTRALAVQGAEILTMTTAYPMDGEDPENDASGRAYEIQADVIAAQSQLWVIQSNQTGRAAKPGAARYYGHSRIVSPFGEVASSGYDEGLVTACVDVQGEIERHIRAKGPRMQRRRPDLYGALSDKRF